MPYTNCAACGAKALVGATRCPRCQAPFVSYDAVGERVPTVNCPNCGVQRPAAIGVCPNCLTSTAPAGARLTRGLVLAGVAVAMIVAVGYLISRRVDHTKQSAVATVSADSSTLAPSADSSAAVAADSVRDSLTTSPSASTPIAESPTKTGAASTPPPPVVAARPAPSPTVAPRPVASDTKPPTADPAMVPPKPAPPPVVAVSDSGVWEYAVATTWVRVRSAPSTKSDVLRMVDSAQRVRLGPPVSGWRPVRVGVDRGWVDPRLFTIVAAPKP